MTQPDITDADREAADTICNPKDNKYLYSILCKKFARHRQTADRAGYERGVRESAGVASSSEGCSSHGIAEFILNIIPGGDDA